MKLRIDAADKSAGNARDKAIADTYENKFIIPLDFEMLDSSAPYYQAGLRNRLCYEIMFNDYSRVINSTEASPDATYKITDISLEYEIVSQPTLEGSIEEYLNNKYALWLDFRMINENSLHGRRIENALEGITLQIKKKVETAGTLNAYMYLIMDAQLNIQNGAYVSAV